MPPPLTKNSLWQFIDEEGTFRVNAPDYVSRLYFPLANEAGLLSSITPNLHGDIKTGHNCFLMSPVTIEDLHNTRSNRNFWVYLEDRQRAWSVSGSSAAQHADKFVDRRREKVSLEAGMLWHKVTRENTELGLKAEVLNFAPAGPDPVELMVVTLSNTGRKALRLTATSAVPIFGRSADNLRDHYHVTSLLHRVISHPAGVVVRPTMSFDERGHKLNEILYGVLGTSAGGEHPVGAFSTVPDFLGEGGSFEAPQAVLENLPTPRKDGHYYHGKSAVGALRFKPFTLAAGHRTSFVLILGIAKKESELDEWVRRYGSAGKAEQALRLTKAYWKRKAEAVRVRTPDKVYNGWLRWVSLQPTFRKLFGCSFLPDFDYGRGGRGWRDLWQDCLALLLTAPSEARELLVNNFNGVRIDGSNATIIGTAPGEFIADRNNITRIWMDHGVWPYLTLELYIHQSGDFGVLLQPARYFRDPQLSRATRKDAAWAEAYGQNLKDKKGTVVEGSILEHLLVQHLVQFFNVGEHNHIRLENADWNDGLDMAYERGESVAFTALYGANLNRLAGLLETAAGRLGLKKVALRKELLILLDGVEGRRVDYGSVPVKRRLLREYFDAVEPVVSGRTVDVPVAKLAEDLRRKAQAIFQHIRQKEWVVTRSGEGLYNGYYDNHGRRVEGDAGHAFQMTLAGQVFPIMAGVAEAPQVHEIWKSARKHLKDKEHGGFRLNTNFNELRLDLGRAFSFAYGEKENGAFFSHMAVMFANALYQRGFVNEGREVLDSIYRMCVRTEKSRIYPGIPEYFNSEGRGLYHYLTGSASWLVLTVLTQVFGVRGLYGDLLLAPKFTAGEFRQTAELGIEAFFAEARISVTYRNTKKIPYEHYCVTKVVMNGRELKGLELNKKEVLIGRDLFLKHARKSDNSILVTLE